MSKLSIEMRTMMAVASAGLVLAGGCKGDDQSAPYKRRDTLGPGSAADGVNQPRAPATKKEEAQEARLAAEKDASRSESQLALTFEELQAANAELTIALEGKRTGVGAGSGAVRARKDDGKVVAPDEPEAESSLRSWFPETFLFEPLIVTDARGQATVPVRVPDRLTSWRILALAHGRNGAQGGAVTSFASTLPVYVDLVVPDALVRGDRVRLPVQLVNTTAAPVATALAITVDNATVTGGGGARTIPAQGSAVEYVTLTADRPGTISLQVGLRGGDAVARTIEVLPLGQPKVTTRSGTLAAPRSVTITGPVGSDPATDRVRLQVFPGALALLRSELGVCTARTGVDDDAYGLLLAGRATGLLTALGDQADPEALRSLAILESQRVIRHARNLDLERATLLVEAALAHGDRPVLTRIGDRAAAFLVQAQRPDGSFGGGAGWTAQRVLVATADATRAVAASVSTDAQRQQAHAVAVRASGEFARHDSLITDAYTAAAVLVSGAASPAQTERLRKLVREALIADADGARYLDAAAGVVRADGRAPSRAEATALAALALAGDPTAASLRADLGATLLGSYDAARGWGDGRANLVALRAVVELFKTPISGEVTITLTMDGTPVTRGVLAADKLREVLTLEAPAPGLAGEHVWAITAEPAVPGLGYALALRSWVPWPTGARAGGLELEAPATLAGTVGKPVEIALRAVAPSGIPLHLRYALPAGAQPDTASLDALVTARTAYTFEVSDGAVDFELPALAPGKTLALGFRVVPTLAGTLHTPASWITGAGHIVHVPPSTWTVQ